MNSASESLLTVFIFFVVFLFLRLITSSLSHRIPELAREINDIKYSDGLIDEYTKDKCILDRKITPYDFYPNPVRLHEINVPELPLLHTSNKRERNLFVNLVLVNQSWEVGSFQQEKKPEPTSVHTHINKIRNNDLSSSQSSSEIESYDLKELTLLEQSNEESFAVELGNLNKNLPSVNNTNFSELDEMMLLSECEEWENYA